MLIAPPKTEVWIRPCLVASKPTMQNLNQITKFVEPDSSLVPAIVASVELVSLLEFKEKLADTSKYMTLRVLMISFFYQRTWG